VQFLLADKSIVGALPFIDGRRKKGKEEKRVEAIIYLSIYRGVKTDSDWKFPYNR